MVLKAGSWSSHCENLCNGQNGLGSRRHGCDAETEAARCKDTWDIVDSKALLVRGDSSTAGSSELLYSLDEARKCGELEAAGLLCGDSIEGPAEFAVRQSAAIFNGCVQQCEGDVMAITLWSPEAWSTMPFNYNDGIECSHITAITSPVHCCN